MNMGYRSEVTVTIVASDDKTLEETLAVWAMTPEYQGMVSTTYAQEWVDGAQERGTMVMHELDPNAQKWVGVEVSVIQWHFDNVKWYDSYPEPKAFAALEELVGSLHTSDRRVPVAIHMLRVGEDSGDVDTSSRGEQAYASELESEIYSVTTIENNISIKQRETL